LSLGSLEFSLIEQKLKGRFRPILCKLWCFRKAGFDDA